MTRGKKGALVPEITVFQNSRKIFSLPLDAQRITIGRSSANDLILTGDQVSRTHAILEWQDGGFFLTDCSSLGTSLNHEKIKDRVLLQDQAQIGISDWLLVYHKQSQSLKQEKKNRQSQITRLTQRKKVSDTRVLQFDPPARFKSFRVALDIDDAGAGKRHFLVKKKSTIIGSSPKTDVVLNDQFVSQFHTEFRLSDQGFLVIDLDSTNGTYINGSKIKESYIHGDEEVYIGKSKITLNFEKESEEELTPFEDDHFCGIYGKSVEMRLLFRKIETVAATDMTVLIQGETGVGKEMVARAIHDLSDRRDKPYVILNCGAISANLIESELFGHEKGAFTGADQRHLGAFEQASGGSLFLDEIGELPLALQAKILRVLEYQTLRRVGGTQEVKVNVRLIAATHRDLKKMVTDKSFREDLFYRLYVLPLNVPALRERKEDIKLLAHHFLQRSSPDRDKRLGNEALKILENHIWPGNVRELKNVLLRALVFCEGKIIKPEYIEIIYMTAPPQIVNEPEPAPSDVNEGDFLILDAKRKLEKEQILNAVKEAKGDRNKAAQILGIGRSTLFRRLNEYGIE